MKVFIDTAPFIYLIEKNERYADKIKKYLTTLFINNNQIITSVITYSEFGVAPIREQKPELINEFEAFLHKTDISLIEIKKAYAFKASELRAKYLFLKGMDSLQIGTAIEENCDVFVSNDFKLKSIKEIDVLLLDKDL